MTVESASYISQLDPTKPAAADAKSEGDDHFRLMKTVLQTQFPNFGAGAVTATHSDLSRIAGANAATFTFSSGNCGVGTATPGSYGQFAVYNATGTVLAAFVGQPTTARALPFETPARAVVAPGSRSVTVLEQSKRTSPARSSG